MDAGDFATQPDARTVSLENQLLRTETQLLRARVDGVEDEINALRSSYEAQMKLLSENSEVITADELEKLQQARNDLQWLLTRLRDSPLSFAYSGRQGFKELLGRHLVAG